MYKWAVAVPNISDVLVCSFLTMLTFFLFLMFILCYCMLEDYVLLSFGAFVLFFRGAHIWLRLAIDFEPLHIVSMLKIIGTFEVRLVILLYKTDMCLCE